MERLNLMEPYDLHLQWFAADPPAPAPAPSPAGPAPQPAPAPTPAPEPELNADGTYLAQAPDKYKKDQKFLKDLLKHKTLGDVLDRMYAAEGQLTELQSKMAPAPKKPEEYEFEELKFPDHLAGDAFVKEREGMGAYLKAKDDELRALGLKAGLSKDSAKLVSGFFREAVFAQWKAAQDEYVREREAGLTALKEAWKGDFVAREEVAKRAILTFGKEALVAKLAKRGLENDPEIIETFYNIGKAIGEGQLVPGKAGPAAPSKEVQEAAARKARYPKSPELTKDLPAASAAPDQAALDKLRARYPKMAAGEAGRT